MSCSHLTSITIALLLQSMNGHAAVIVYTDWTAANPGGAGSASGTMSGISVAYSGEVNGGSEVTGGGVNWWERSSPPPYNNSAYNAYSGVPNMPPNSDIIILNGGQGTVNTLTFSPPVKDPVMLVLSLGRYGIEVRYDFDQDFSILSSGTGYWGGNASGSLWKEAGYVLAGQEGHGAIQFSGVLSSISWTAAPTEAWHGFTVGVGVVPEPLAATTFAGVGLLVLATARSFRRRRS